MDQNNTLNNFLARSLSILFALVLGGGQLFSQVECSVVPPGEVDTNSEAYLIVVSLDDFCCNEEWDGLCQARYDVLTGVPCTAAPGMGVDVESQAYLVTLVFDPECCYGDWDSDCAQLYSEIIAANVEEVAAKEVRWTVFPNPGNGDFTIAYEGESGNAVIEVLDLTGRMVHATREVLMAGTQTQLSLSGVLSSGAYILRITAGSDRQETRIVVQ